MSPTGSGRAGLLQEGPLTGTAQRAPDPGQASSILQGPGSPHWPSPTFLRRSPESAQMALGSDQIMMVTLTRVQIPAAPLWSFKTEVDGVSPSGLVLRGNCDVWGSAPPWGVGLKGLCWWDFWGLGRFQPPGCKPPGPGDSEHGAGKLPVYREWHGGGAGWERVGGSGQVWPLEETLALGPVGGCVSPPTLRWHQMPLLLKHSEVPGTEDEVQGKGMDFCLFLRKSIVFKVLT